ncbi:MAG: DUF503 domain-containing protein [Deinococcota bacterium]
MPDDSHDDLNLDDVSSDNLNFADLLSSTTQADDGYSVHAHDDYAGVYVGVCLLHLEMPWVRSLKEKRALVKPIAEKLKTRFPVSVSRLDGLNDHDWELLGISAISHDPTWLEGVLNKASRFAKSISECRMYEVALEVERWR